MERKFEDHGKTHVQKERRKRMERKTARVFFSSPFGGLEEEREELTKKYWPRLESMCNKAGYDFIPVDLRWGNTSEMSSSAVTIKVCLNEMDRSDMIVGFFGQRYGWHGDNELLQKSFDVAAEFYPWLNDYRDKSVTELEYLHGHLRNPGARAACFFFRDKAYDDMKLEEAKKTGNEREIRKFIASTDGPHAAERLADLKRRIDQTRDKCLAVHMNYKNPKEGARLMFETIEKYFTEVLLAKPAVKLTEREEENLQHDVFLASRLGMGGNYVGGQKYLDEIDKYFLNQENKKLNHVLVLGYGSSGNSCMLSNWITLHQMRKPRDIIIYHFVGSTSRGTDPKYIMFRLVNELNDELQGRVQHDDSFASDPNDDMRQLVRKLTGLMLRVKETGCKAFIIIDALNKIDELSKTMKTLYWLPKDIPPSVYVMVSTLISDSASIKELTERGYHKMHTKPLDIKERQEMALTALKKRGKTLSNEQQKRVFSQKQTENPLYLEILLMELVSFGEFFQLDAYIDSLTQANDTKALFLKYLERLEKDYNPEDYHGNLAEEITCCIHLARHGLSQKEICSILDISSRVWSSIFFAMDDFLIERDGLYSFSFNELGEAIEERYFKDDKKKEYIGKIADYFDEKLKERSPLYNTTIPSRIYSELPWLLTKQGDIDRLVECILKPAVFYSLKDGLSKYDLIAYWNATGLSDDEIVAKQQKVIDDQLALFYNEAEEKGEEPKTALDMMIPFVYDLAQFLSDAGRVKAAEPFLERALQMTKALHKIEDIKGDPVIAATFCDIGNTLACHYVDTEQFEKADLLHHEVLELKEKFERSLKHGTKSLARTLNGLGVLNFKQSKYQETLNFYKRSLDKHREAHSSQHEIAEMLNNIGSVYHALGQWEDAVEQLKESLEIYEEAFFGQLPADVGGTMLNLAMAYRRLNKYKEAEPLYLRALEIRKNAYGENHHEVGQTLLSYSAFLLHDRPQEAAECSKRAAEIYETSMGLDHINTLNALENVALAYLIMQKPAEAHPYFKKAGERKEATDRMDTSIQKVNAVMADYYLNSGQNEEARQLFGRIVKASFATDRDFAALDFLDLELPVEKRPKRKREHTILYAIEKFPKSAMILGRIQELYSANGNGKEMVQVLKNGEFGVEHYNNAYQAFVKHNHKKEGIVLLVAAHEKFPDDKIVMYNLASAHAAYKDYPSASAMFKELLNKDPNDLSTLESYANVLSLTGRVHEGRDMYNKALKMAEKASDKTAVDRLSSRIKLLNDM